MSLFTNSEDLATRVKAEIAEIKYATLATVSTEGQPWNSPVFTAYDEQYNFFWGSPEESTHSKNIEANGKLAIVLYDSRAVPGTGKGTYIVARAHRLTDPAEMKFAYELLIMRRGAQASSYWKFSDFEAPHAIHFYKAEPREISTHGGDMVDGVYIDRRRTVQL
jgi:Pyridoxamine 5'-phosphate oxidase